MFLFLVSFLAGIITVATPCVLPLLPIIIGGSLMGGSKKRSYTIIISLIFTVVVFTLILKFFTIFINIPQEFWNYFSGVLLILLSISILFPDFWYKIPLIGKISVLSNKELGVGFIKNNFWGDVIIGASLGPVFSTCSPTYFIILATVLPANFLLGLVYLATYSVGLGLALLLISLLGQKAINKFEFFSNPKSKFRLVIGILFLIMGILIFSGKQEKVNSYFIDKFGDKNPANLENILLKKNEIRNQNDLDSNSQFNINNFMQNARINFQSSLINSNYGRYQEFVNPSGFINTPNDQPIKMSDYIGKKIILIDFMTYSCINCQRTFPYLNDWYSKYESKGLVIIGIHTPEFAFEHKKENVEKALDQFGIKFPVVLDNYYGTWNAYKNQFWPRKYLIDLNGDIVYDHSGEGEYQETEDKIVELLNTLPENQKNNLKDGIATTTFNPDFSSIGSRETYLGYDRLDYSAINIQKECFDSECTFTAPSTKNFPNNTFSFDGKWTIKNQEADAISGANLYYNFSASKVHLVAGSKNGAKIKVTLDGNQNTAKVYNISSNTLYTVVDLNGKYESHIMKLEIISGDLEAYAFTFS